ncbi:T9SS type A sorting domain-containing protein [Flavivirga algicola]|uniref:T9SS type A sorting domain-containing protein n=1 Tax=Flavivirga algicola TaxID=2729136 RepID=A0ABX1S1W7_9FLAO|nr:T9SS type A sorting domain-containing protein [Flavivirga algicola]NMH88627.1 T9SS type A sorting domain-containing protein [Flavivirga algicola]
MRKLSYLLLLLFSNSLIAQDHSVYFIGHSLIAHTIPQMIDELANDDAETTYNFAKQIINGSPLSNQWENPERGEGDWDYSIDLPTGNYDRLIVTEAVPLQNHLTWSNTYEIVDNFNNFFHQHSPNGQMYIYETWHCINSGPGLVGCSYDNDDHLPWRQRLDDDLVKWEGIADYTNALNPDKEVLIIPGGQAMGRLYDAIENNTLSGVNSIEHFYSDDIHLNEIGSYFIACVMYATIYKKSPEGLTVNTNNVWGIPYDSPGDTLGRQLQEIAWATVSGYDRSGVSNTTLSVVDADASNIKVYSTPSSLVIKNIETTGDVALYDIGGRMINKLKINKFKEDLSIPINGLKGIYLVSVISSNGSKVNKKVVI